MATEKTPGARSRPIGRLTTKVVAEALRASAGIQSSAAQKLKVDRSTICKFVKKHQKLQHLIADIVDEMNDLAEGHLLLALQKGEVWAIKYWLDSRGQERGYGIRKLAFRDQDGEITIPAVLITDGRMTEEEWDREYGNGGQPVDAPAITQTVQ